MSRQTIDDLAGAVVDGDIIDWPAVRARLDPSERHTLTDGLKTLSQLTIQSPATAVREGDRRLPILLEAARLIALVCIVVGSIGHVGLLRDLGVARYGIFLAFLTAYASAALFLDIGGADRRARALAACYWFIAASFSARGVVWIAQLWPESTLLKFLASLRPEAFLAAGLWLFAREFPAITRFSRLDRASVIGFRLALVIGVVLFVANIIPVVAPDSRIDAWAAPFQRLTGYGRWFWNVLFGAAIAALIVIAWRGRGAIGREAARVRFFLYTLAFTILPVAMEVVAEGLFPRFGELMQTPRGRWWGGWFIYPPNFALPILTAYAVAVDNVLEVRVVIQQALRYLLARWIIMWGATVPLAMLVWHLYRHSDRSLIDALAVPPAPVLIWVDLVAIVLLVFRQRLVHVLDRWALPGVQDPSAMLVYMTDRMKQARTPLEVSVVFAKAVERALQAPADPYLVRLGALVSTRREHRVPPRNSLLPILLEGSGEPCVVGLRQRNSYYRLMTPDDRAWIAEQGVSVLVPVASGRTGGGLLGIIAIKNRRNALAFSRDDLRFLRAAAASAGLACDVIQSEANPSGRHAGVDSEEVGIQCTGCGRVETWLAANGRCTCGGGWEPAVLPKHLVGQFEVVQKLGAGGMGVVYRAKDLTLGRDVAVKTLTRLAEDSATHLLVEARTMAGLSHAHVAVLFGIEMWRSTPILVMEYLSGGTLAARLRGGPLPAYEAVRIAKLLASALEHLHRNGLYHGDIKPSNIGFTADGIPKFLDFGLSRAITTRSALGGPDPNPLSFCGTWAYSSPEVRSGAAPGPALDIWALCVTLCESVLGTHPFPIAETNAEIAAGVTGAVEKLERLEAPDLGRFLNRVLKASSSRDTLSALTLVEGLTSVAIRSREATP